MNQLSRSAAFFLTIVLLAALAGCGYRVAGSGIQSGGKGPERSLLPGGVESVSIPLFINQTTEPSAEVVITNAFIKEFLSAARVTAGGYADSRLVGIIKAYEKKPVSFSRTDVVKEYRLKVAMSVSLVRTKDNVTLWQDHSVVDYEDFDVVENGITSTEDAERAAIETIAFNVARLIKERIIEGF
jgi:hypothetical protein